jgi:tripeptide aminopeptidase
MSRESLLDRFCRYVRIDTQAREGVDACPSSPGQLELGRLLTAELRAAGVADAAQDEHGVVTGTVPAAGGRPDAPTVALLAHMDTAPEMTGRGVKPMVHADYAGGDIVLPGDPGRVLRPAENPELAAVVGHTLITTDGTTLLGADNKAGLAVIMETVAYLAARPEQPRCRLRVCFTCDEEIGRGVDHVDLPRLGAQVAYTLDGTGRGEIDVETFSADMAVVAVRGRSIHPSIGKGRMVNAVRILSEFVSRLPRRTLAPEVTEGRQGFLHPYRLQGTADEASVNILLRDFATPRLRDYEALLRAVAESLAAEYPEAGITVTAKPQYRNMLEGLSREPRAVPLAQEAMRRAGLEPRLTIVRGGTDGSRLTEMGLPTPNLSTGEHNPHSPLEWTTVEEMQDAVRVCVELARLWGREPARR